MLSSVNRLSHPDHRNAETLTRRPASCHLLPISVMDGNSLLIATAISSRRSLMARPSSWLAQLLLQVKLTILLNLLLKSPLAPLLQTSAPLRKGRFYLSVLAPVLVSIQG